MRDVQVDPHYGGKVPVGTLHQPARRTNRVGGAYSALRPRMGRDACHVQLACWLDRMPTDRVCWPLLRIVVPVAAVLCVAMWHLGIVLS